MDLFQPPLSERTVGKMKITVYPQLILITKGEYRMRYSGYSQTQAINEFRKYLRKHKPVK